ncbi:type I-E CRISPR-associated protein Cse1/CasA [Syntrophorhabdus aromaticivorans]|uniref:type I-E CRISPR-associated protein Cse1/CasA n=1 Tax=Syntrophorhabdus aromaticivorans TaxID=328301 RepID=UPI000417EFF2|nr:type I-E CRISPR-associated protein Cse1/CasA [Syntrophorhabdus aromaticivorans]
MSAPHSYNLLVKPWIPVTWRNDAAEPREPKVGITEALQRSRDIRSISHTSPFIEFGLYRLLITIVLDAYIVAGRRPTIGKMKQMLALGFGSCVYKYLDDYKHGFDLWNDDNRFLQPKPIDDTKAGPVANLFSAVPSGANVIHWHHFLEDEDDAPAVGAAASRISEEEAAQWLTTVSPFTFKGKYGAARTLAGDPPIYALVLGRSLFETLVLNLPRPSGRVTAKQELERGASWRTTPDFAETKLPTLAEGFTWPVRYIRLERGRDAITKSIYAVAFKKTKETKINAPVYDVKYGWRPKSTTSSPLWFS